MVKCCLLFWTTLVLAIASSRSFTFNRRVLSKHVTPVVSVETRASPTCQKASRHWPKNPSRSAFGKELFGAKKNYDGFDRGQYILGLVFLLCVWTFSIPPEFRRAHICTSDLCVEHRKYCYDCVTAREWAADVADYYKNGGGIQFDFTVDQSTKDIWSGAGR